MITKKTKITTTDETRNFDIESEDIKIVKDFAHLLSHPFKWKLQPRNQGKAATQKGNSGRIRKDGSLRTKRCH